MKSKPDKQDGYTAFSGLLEKVVSVPHDKIKEELEAEKRNRNNKKKNQGHETMPGVPPRN